MDAERITEHATQSVQHMMQQQQARSLRDQYLTENPDFLEWQKSGVLEKVKKSDKYGFHDDFSASIQYQLEKERESKAEDIAKAVKEAEARILKQFKVKGESRTLGAAPVTAPSEDGFDPALKDPKKYGGKTNVLAQRLAERRREAH
jgi:hypothetical protein